MKNSVLLLSASVMLVGCMSLADFGKVTDYTSPHQPGEVVSIATKTYGQDMGGQTVHSFQLYYNCALDGAEDQIIIQRISGTGRPDIYRLHHEFYGDDPRHMRSLTVTLDGQDFTFTDDHPLYSEPGGKVDENLFYTVDATFLKKLAQAKAVTLKFYRDPVVLPKGTVILLSDALEILKGL